MASRLMNEDIFDKITDIYNALPNGELKEMINVFEEIAAKQTEITESIDSITKGLEDAKKF